MDPALPLVVAPPAIAQGDPVLVRVRAPGASQAIAALSGRETPLVAVAPDVFAGIVGAGLDIDPGQHALHVTLIDGGGNAAAQSVMLAVHDGRYGGFTEAIRLEDALLDAAASDAETARLNALWAERTPDKMWSGAWRRPVTGTVSSPFGGYRDYNGGVVTGRHTGLDLRGARGTPVFAPARGRVALAEPLAIRGNVVWLDHGWGVFSGYFHLAEILVAAGAMVDPGTVLGTVGATGRATAPHLHWEVRVGGEAVSPIQWVLRDVGAVP